MNHKTRSFLIILALILGVSAYSQNPPPRRGIDGQPKRDQPQSAKQPTSQNQRGTESAPLVIRQIQPPKTAQEAAQDEKDRADKTANDRKLVDFSGELVIATFILAVVGILQLVVFGVQSHYLRKTVNAAGEQSDAMERSISEANRLASAMEKVAEHM
jgi:hypothetical protein